MDSVSPNAVRGIMREAYPDEISEVCIYRERPQCLTAHHFLFSILENQFLHVAFEKPQKISQANGVFPC